MSQYDAYPTTPSGDATPAKPEKPSSVRSAVLIILVSIALGVISFIISLARLDTIVDDAVAGSGVDPGAAKSAAVVGLVIGGLLGIAIPALLAMFISKGANWARITYTVLAVIGLVFSVIGLGALPALQLVLSVIGIVLTIITIVLLFRPDANAYFKKTPVVG